MYQIVFCLANQNPLTDELLRTTATTLELAEATWDALDVTCRMLSPRPTEANQGYHHADTPRNFK
jgi:hypothetical protein